MSRNSYLISGAAVAITAATGGAATDVDSAWYRRLKKPPFQPPGPVFGLAWTVLYALIAVSAGRALSRLPGPERRPYAKALGLNLVLNVGWSWVFFRGHSPAAATVDILALQASNVDLARRTTRIDRAAGLLLAPYLLWVGFASVLTGDILRRNR